MRQFRDTFEYWGVEEMVVGEAAQSVTYPAPDFIIDDWPWFVVGSVSECPGGDVGMLTFHGETGMVGETLMNVEEIRVDGEEVDAEGFCPGDAYSVETLVQVWEPSTGRVGFKVAFTSDSVDEVEVIDAGFERLQEL